MKDRPTVALIVETSIIYGRQILHGVARYMRTHGEWAVFLDERELGAPPPEWLAGWEGDGIICRSTTPQLAAQFKARGLPVVDLNDQHGNLGLPRISSDMQAIGRTAAAHLLERGFTNLAFCGFSSEPWSRGRCEGVMQALSDIGHFCGAYESSWQGLRHQVWESERAEIAAWLRTLPRPLGIVACNDARGHHVLETCRYLGIAVPESVAVVGVDDARTICEMCSPPLSSVMPDADNIGYKAAQLLDQMMNRQHGRGFEGRVEDIDWRIPPKGVMARQSTDAFAVEDAVVARALWLIRNYACDGISIEDIVKRIPSSRSTLERSFRQCMGHSPQEEIRSVRIKRVKKLLEETEYSLARIAEISGFKHSEYMMVQFKKFTGQTPSEWRQVALRRREEEG